MNRRAGSRLLLTTGLVAAVLGALVAPAASSAVTKAIPAAIAETTWKVGDGLPPTGPPTTFTYGSMPFAAFMGDWNGDGIKTPGIYQGGKLKLSNTIPAGAPTITVTFGDSRGFPVAGDSDDDGRDDVAIYLTRSAPRAWPGRGRCRATPSPSSPMATATCGP